MQHKEEQQDQENENQQPRGDVTKNEKQRGAAMYSHSHEEIIYGPESPLPERYKIFFCIRHLRDRDWENTLKNPFKKIDFKKVSGLTGIKDKSNFNKYVKILVKEKMIEVTQAGEEVFYNLHPYRFGQWTIFKRGITKKHLSLIDQEVSPVDQETSLPDYPPFQETAPAAASQTQKTPQEPLQEPFKNLSRRVPDYFDKTRWDLVREKLIESNPEEEKQIDKIYRELHQKMTDDLGRPIGCLPALMLSSYSTLKKSREYSLGSKPKPAPRDLAERKEESPINLDLIQPFWRKFVPVNSEGTLYGN